MLNTKNLKRALLVGTALTMINPTLAIAGKKGKGPAAADPKNVVVYNYKTTGMLGSTNKVTQEQVELYKGGHLKSNNKFVKHVDKLLKQEVLTEDQSALLNRLDIFNKSKVAKESVAAGSAPGPASPTKTISTELRAKAGSDNSFGNMKVSDRTQTPKITIADMTQLAEDIRTGAESTGRAADLKKHMQRLNSGERALNEPDRHLLQTFEEATKKLKIKAKSDADAAERAREEAVKLAAEERAREEAARVAAEERAREDAARVAAEERAREEAERVAAEERARKIAKIKAKRAEVAKAKAKEDKTASNLKTFEDMFGKAKKKSGLSKAKTLDDAIPSKASTTELKPISFDDTKKEDVEVTLFSDFDAKTTTAKIKTAEAKLDAAKEKFSDAEGVVLDLFADDHEVIAREEAITSAKTDMKIAEEELNELKAKIKESGKKALAPVVEEMEVGVAKVEAKSAEDKLITSEVAINAANADVEAKKTALEAAKIAFENAEFNFNDLFDEDHADEAKYNAAKLAFENAEAELVAAEKVLADAEDAKIELVAKKEEAKKTIETAKSKAENRASMVKALLAKAKEIKAEKEAEQAAKKKELIAEESDVIEPDVIKIEGEKLKSTQYVKEVSKVIFSKLKDGKVKAQQKIEENSKLGKDQEKESLSIGEKNLSKLDLEYLQQETDQIFEKISNDEKATQKIAEEFLISMNDVALNPDSFKDLQNALEDDEKSSEIQTEFSEEQIDLALAFNDAAKSSEERNRIEKSGTQAAEDNAKVAKELSKTPQTVTARVADQKLSRILNRSFGAAQGVAAGDSFSPRLDNVWVKGIIGKANQGAKINHSGYNGNNAGFTVGSDLELNDKTIIGIAYSNMNSNFKFKNSRSGDKISGRGHMFSVYSIYEFNDRWSMDAIVSAGKTDIKSKRLATGNRTANAKINNQNFNAEANVNYRIPFSSLVLIPNAGLKYGYFKDKAYKEKGAGQYNMNVASTTNSTVIGVVGIDAMMPYNLSENTKIIPTLHASVANELSSKKSDVKFKWRNKNFTVNPEDSSDDKLSFNIGGGLTAQRNNIELSADYNCNLQKKYTNHQGSLKLKLSF